MTSLLIFFGKPFLKCRHKPLKQMSTVSQYLKKLNQKHPLKPILKRVIKF